MGWTAGQLITWAAPLAVAFMAPGPAQALELSGGLSLGSFQAGSVPRLARRCADRWLPTATYPRHYKDRLRECAAYPPEYGDMSQRLAVYRQKSGYRAHVTIDRDVCRAFSKYV
jgi:hypothetical protein